MNNLEKLCRTPDGRYRAGIFIAADPVGRFCSEVVLARRGVEHGEIITLPAQRLPPQATFEDAERVARAWALKWLPRIYECAPEGIGLELLRGGPIFR